MNEAPKTGADFFKLLASMGEEWLIDFGLSPESAQNFIAMVNSTPDPELNQLSNIPSLSPKEAHKLLWDLVGERPRTWEELYAALKTRIDAPHAAVNKPYILGKGGLDDARKDHQNPQAPSR